MDTASDKTPTKGSTPRFRIEKLEERIAPRCYRVRGYRYCDGGGGNGGCHYNPQGKMVGSC